MTTLDKNPGRFSVTYDRYTIEFTPRGLPLFYDRQVEHATLLEEYEPHAQDLCCMTVRRRGEGWPFLVVTQDQSSYGMGFAPGALFVAKTTTLFLGAGERILAYQLEPVKKIWEDNAKSGFLGWEQHGDTILLSSELELGAWDTAARKLWTMVVEPPWDYTVSGDMIELAVMGKMRSFDLRTGPPGER